MRERVAPAHVAHLAVAAVSGLSVTVIEFAAVRFMAPWFGQSNYVWANVIGVILLSLSLGYWFGGRLADRSRTGTPLYVAYALAAIWVGAMTWLGPHLADVLLPQGVASSRVLPIAFTGSLTATVVLFGPPTLVLGMTSPFLIRLDDRPGRAGRVAGRVFAVGTLGSLAGCYLAPLWMLQALGSRATLLSSAAALALLSAAGLAFGARRRRALAAAALGLAAILVAGWAAFAAGEASVLRRQPGQVAEVESGYQTIRVVEQDAPLLAAEPAPLRGAEISVPTRFLRHDEDTETYQSVWLPKDSERLFTGGRYFEHMALGSRFTTLADREVLRVLIVGYAGGSTHRMLRQTVATGVTLEILGVEIDPAVIEVARAHLDLDALLAHGEATIVSGEDARTVVNALPADRRFDLVLVDAYARTNYVPFQVASVEFFEQVERRLAPGGWVGFNVLATSGMRSRLAMSVAATMDRALGNAYVVPNALYPGNLLLWSGKDAERAPRLVGEPALPAALESAAFALERLAVRWGPRGDAVILTDDRSPSDLLADEELFGP